MRSAALGKRVAIGLCLAVAFAASGVGAGRDDRKKGIKEEIKGLSREKSSGERTWNRQENVIYGHKFGTGLLMDVFTPKKDANGLGVIMIVSGAWVSGREGINTDLVEPLTDRGYVVFTVLHGSAPKYTIPENVKDLKRAVRFIRYHAKKYGIDPDRLGVTGMSAGGHLSLMLGTTGSEGEKVPIDAVDRVSCRVQSVACFFPPTDFFNFGKKGENALGRGRLSKFRAPFDFQEWDASKNEYVPVTDEEKIEKIGRSICPIDQVSHDDAPTLIMHGDADPLVPLQQSESMIEALKDKKVECRLIVKHGGVHGWPGLTKDMSKFVDWFDRTLGAKSEKKEGSGTREDEKSDKKDE